MKPLSKLAYFIFLTLTVSGSKGAFSQEQNEMAAAAIRLKQAHVRRSFEQCKSQDHSDKVCRAELESLHPRELAVLQNILNHSRDYDELYLSKATASCYSPTRNYLELIECWEDIADRMEAGAKDLFPTNISTSPDDVDLELIDELNSFEKRSLVLCVRGRVGINFRDTVAHNLQNGGNDALWAMKINAYENRFMADLARKAQWTEIASYYDFEFNYITKLIRGEIDQVKYKLLSKNNEGRLRLALDPELSKQSQHARTFEKLDGMCQEVATRLIGKSKALASE